MGCQGFGMCPQVVPMALPAFVRWTTEETPPAAARQALGIALRADARSLSDARGTAEG